MTIRPMCRVASSPIFFQVFPPSSDLYAPSPQDELWRLFGSPVPTHTTEGSEGAMAMSPIVDTASLSNTGCHVVPLFVVFHTPPEATPTNTIFGLLSTTAKSSMRPPITAGPISRNSRLLNLSVGFGWSPAPASIFVADAPKNNPTTTTVPKADHTRFMINPSARGPASYSGALPHASFVSGSNLSRDERDARRGALVSRTAYTTRRPRARLSNCFDG